MTARILVVENDEKILDILKYYLEQDGYEVATHQDPIAAVESLSRVKYGLAVLDVALPRMDGYQVAKEIRVNPGSKEIPILFISGKVGVPDALRRESQGKIEYMPKPIHKKEFLATVARLTGRVDAPSSQKEKTKEAK